MPLVDVMPMGNQIHREKAIIANLVATAVTTMNKISQGFDPD